MEFRPDTIQPIPEQPAGMTLEQAFADMETAAQVRGVENPVDVDLPGSAEAASTVALIDQAGGALSEDAGAQTVRALFAQSGKYRSLQEAA